MRPIPTAWALTLPVAVFCTVACDTDDRRVTAPTPVAAQSQAPDSPTPSGPLRVAVIDGWTEKRIAGAVVTSDGQRVVTEEAGCNHTWSVWTYAASGFCMQRTEEYFVAQANVDPARLSTPAMALRVLMTFMGFRPHRLPGMFNDARSDDALSDFELRTLHMVGLRNKDAPAGVDWPDTGR